jgi:hypothetical protein
MAQDTQQRTGTPNNYQSDRGGATLISEAVIGVVKDNVDPSHSGRVQVYIAKFGGSDPNDSKSWVTVSYLSPFYGVSGPGNNPASGGSKDGFGKYVGNPQSFGFWAGAPEIGTQVLCLFVDGDTQNGFYLGCVPQAGLLSMTPALGSTKVVVPNEGESKTYGGADRLPTGEVNTSNPNIKNSATIVTDPKPVHSYQAAILLQQGLLRDNARGVISSSAQRETPSKVFGISTPGGPIFEGGYNNSNIKSAAAGGNAKKLDVIGRTGGHSFVMDDGDLQGQDQLTRIRTASGHMIMMNDSAQSLFIIHANGQSWLELGKEGTIDMYATNSVNIRTEGDLNLHADRDLNFHANRNFTLYGKNINLESDNDLNFRSGANFSQFATGKYTVKSGGDLGFLSGGNASLAGSSAYINGKSKIYLNSGNSGTTPAEVPVIPKVNHPDTTYSTEKGWMYPSPNALLSVASRAPTHMPWIASGKGVDVSVSNSTDSSKATSTPSVDKVNNSTPSVPKKATNPSINGTVPTQKGSSVPNLNAAAVTSLTGQQAASNSTLPSGKPPARAIKGNGTSNPGTTIVTGSNNQQPGIDTKRASGILPGAAGLTLEQACGPGMALKPGSNSILQARLDQGMPYEKAIQGLLTGNNGATTIAALLTSVKVQTGIVASSINNAATSLVNAGVLLGTESAAQAGGVVLAAANYGTNAVVGLVNGTLGAVTGIAQGITNTITGTIGAVSNIAQGISNTASKISDSIAGGKFAGQLSDSISNGISGLANSVKGAITSSIDNLGKSLGGLVTGLTGTLRNAFNTVEASFKNLTANAPNILGGSGNASNITDLSTPSAKYESAQADIDSAQESYDAARVAYRNNPDDINKQALASAESAVSDARKKGAGASLGIITGGVGSVYNSVSSAVSSARTSIGNFFSQPANTLNSGINALPGGANSTVNQVNVNGSGKSTVNNLSNSLTTQLGNNNPLRNTSNVVGNLVTNTTNGIVNSATNIITGTVNAATNIVTGVVNTGVNLVTNIVNLPGQIVNSIANTANGIISSVQTAIASIGNMGGQIKAAIAASNTFNKTDIVAKTGVNLGDVRIPTPISMIKTPEATSDTTSDSESDNLEKQRSTLSDLNQTYYKKEEVSARINSVYDKRDSGEISSEEAQSQVAVLDKEKQVFNTQISQYKNEYQNIVQNQNQPVSAEVTPTGWNVSSSKKSIFADGQSSVVNLTPEEFKKKYGG